MIASCQGKNNEKVASSWSQGTYEENLSEMKKKTESMLAHLKQYKLKEDEPKRVVCYFSTDSEKNAQALSSELGKLEYAVNADEYSPEKPWMISAKSTEININEKALLSWVEQMCKLSFNHGCRMEGWSVSPKRK